MHRRLLLHCTGTAVSGHLVAQPPLSAHALGALHTHRQGYPTTTLSRCANESSPKEATPRKEGAIAERVSWRRKKSTAQQAWGNIDKNT